MLISVMLLIMFPLGTIAAAAQPAATTIKVTVAFFSGRNDPEWKVLPSAQLKQLLTNAKGPFPENMPVKLGYKGMLVINEYTKEKKLFVGPGTSELQLQLLETMPRGLLKSGDIEDIKKAIGSGRVKAPIYKVRGKRHAPPYNPDFWNAIETGKRRRQCNNCYNYANRRTTDTFAQPGYASGHKYTQYTIPDLVKAAEHDGLTQLKPQPHVNAVPRPPNRASRHLVALVIQPETANHSGDYHWYRLDNNGRWSHKPGSTFVTQNDNSDVPITDPRNADRGGYTEFAGFMVSNRITIQIKGYSACDV